jgi:hypothetical protein
LLPLKTRLAPFAAAALLSALAPAARADIPAGYLGTPFNPATVGGAGIIPPTVKAGPFQLPGRLDLVNYDLGGEGVAYHSEAHYTTKDGDGYRTDRPTATMCKTVTTKPDIWYDTGDAAKDGMPYPPADPQDFYIGSVHPNDWFNYTVDVQTAGMYTLSANFATGNGPPGGEGGDGDMELQISVNGVQQADWKTVFPDFQNKANFHNWKPYPAFAKLTLEKGISVIKFQAPFKHLNLDYVQFTLDGAGGGGAGGASAGGAAGAGTGGTTSTGGALGTAGTLAGGSGGTTTGTGESGTTTTTTSGGGASSVAGSTSTAGSTTVAGTSPTTNADSGDSSGCALGKRVPSTLFSLGALLGLSFAMRSRRRAARR